MEAPLSTCKKDQTLKGGGWDDAFADHLKNNDMVPPDLNLETSLDTRETSQNSLDNTVRTADA